MNKKIQYLFFIFLLVSTPITYAREVVEMVVATTPGGSQDLSTRQLQKILINLDSTRDYIVVNKPGAGGSIGYNYAIKNSNPTILMISGGTFSEILLNQSLSEIQKEVTLFGPVWFSPGVLSVGANSGINNLADLIKRGKEKRITCGAASRSIKLALDNFVQGTGMPDAEVILYKGTQDGMPGLISGDLDCWLDGLNGPIDALNTAGKIKIIASSENRAPEILPGLPLMKNYLPHSSNFYYAWWLAIGIPESNNSEFKKNIVPILNKATRMLESTETVKIHQPEQFDPRFFSNWATFVKKLNENNDRK